MLGIAPSTSVMARNNKWIEADCGNEPVSEVARRTIRSRLKNVCRWLPEAADGGLHDGDSVHQMRVATRRAIVAIELFESLLPRSKSRWFRKQLKRIRKAAGPARDLDVMAKRLARDEEQTAGKAAFAQGLSELLEQVAEAREEAQVAIVKLHRKLKKAEFSQRVKKLVSRVRWRQPEASEPLFHAAAAAGMRTIVTEFFAAAEADLECTQALHEVRLVAKRLRYAMEVFVDAFSPAFREELYPLVEQLQEKLGAVNDHVTAREQYSKWLDQDADESQRVALDQLIAQETAALQQATEAFRQWWTPQRAAEVKSHFGREIGPTEARCA